MFGKAKTKPDGALPSLKPEIAVAIFEALIAGHKEWIEELVHVGARLGSVQGFCEDPGPMYKIKAKKAEEKRLAKSNQPR